MKQITAKYNHAKDQLEYTVCMLLQRYVQKRLFDSHETVAAGMPVVSIISEGSPEVEINLPAVEYIVDSSLPATIVHSIFILIKDMLWN